MGGKSCSFFFFFLFLFLLSFKPHAMPLHYLIAPKDFFLEEKRKKKLIFSEGEKRWDNPWEKLSSGNSYHLDQPDRPYNLKSLFAIHQNYPQYLGLAIRKRVFVHIWIAKVQISLYIHDQDLHCPLTQSLDTTECKNKEKRIGWYFAHAQDDLSLRIFANVWRHFTLEAANLMIL